MADRELGRLPKTAKRAVFATLLLIGFAVAIWIAAAGHGGPLPNSAPDSTPATTSTVGADVRPVPPAPAVQPPAAPAPGAAPDAPQGQPNTAGIAGYTVIVGDTLAAIALRHNVPFEQLAADNGIADANVIQPGQRLSIKPMAAEVEVIQPGTTLTSYAVDRGTSTAALAALNPQISDDDHILAGGMLRVAPRPNR